MLQPARTHRALATRLGILRGLDTIKEAFDRKRIAPIRIRGIIVLDQSVIAGAVRSFRQR